MADATFWNGIADRYAARPIGDVQAYERKLEITRKYLSPGMDVLEFGCGTGGTAVKHAPLVKSYRAVDISERMIGHALERDGADCVGFEVGEFDDLQLAPESLDMVLGLSILHLMPDPAASIAKVHAALRPGGYFVSSTVCAKALWYMRPLLWAAHAVGKAPGLSWFSANELRNMMKDAGFTIVEDLHPGGRHALFLVAQKGGGA